MRISTEMAATITGWIRVSIPAQAQNADVKWTEVYAKGFWRVNLGKMQPNKDEGRNFIIHINQFFFLEEGDAMAFRFRWIHD